MRDALHLAAWEWAEADRAVDAARAMCQQVDARVGDRLGEIDDLETAGGARSPEERDRDKILLQEKQDVGATLMEIEAHRYRCCARLFEIARALEAP